ncbi:MAG: Gfo/Idh/MocA family oxidoreductase [Planctomycetes bacterium]|nr:Gfo/Idh/MocA family oxidoreductase [Planctomycetota bacterium]
MSQRVVRFGLLGAGLIAPFHARAIRAAAGCELVAVADMNGERAGKIAAEFGCRACATLDDLLADKSIDVVNILTPNHLHRDAAIAAANAGRHVLTEKPPAMSLADTDAMIAAAQKAGVKLGVVLQCRVRGAIRAMREALAQERFGRVLRADAQMKWYRSTEYYRSDPWRSSRRSGAGVTIQHAFHYIDLLHYLMGPVASVRATMSNVTHPDVDLEDTLSATLGYANGAQGSVFATTALWPGCDVRIELHGENGTAVMVGERMETWKFRDERAGDEAVRNMGRGVKTAAGGPADFDFADHQTVIEGMARVVREGVDPLITAASARGTLEVALAMYQSARTDREVVLPMTDESGVWG